MIVARPDRLRARFIEPDRYDLCRVAGRPCVPRLTISLRRQCDGSQLEYGLDEVRNVPLPVVVDLSAHEVVESNLECLNAVAQTQDLVRPLHVGIECLRARLGSHRDPPFGHSNREKVQHNFRNYIIPPNEAPIIANDELDSGRGIRIGGLI